VCGICGYVGRPDPKAIEAMTQLLTHRGPDGDGVRFFPGGDGRVPVALGHRRLAIIDRSPRGAQPMSYADGRYWLTYNGELYNYRELRRELEGQGLRFSTGTDTEVLLAMYARHGVAMLPRLNGMFAFALWDADRQQLFMARDRLGIKPLYWSKEGEALYFASEIKALLPALPRARMRTELVPDYLTFLWVPGADTLFAGIYKLDPGHCATFRDGRLSIRRWWDMAFQPEERTEREWATIVRETVASAVRRQMVSDVPLGSFLSGGIDSSAIVAMMSQTTEHVTTYTVGFSPEDLAHDIVPDDLRYARLVARQFGTDYHEEVLKPKIVDLLPQLIWHMDEPIADPAAISTYLICAAARERLTVILSGMGGDEVFAGYPRHLAASLARGFDLVPQRLRTAVRHGLEGRLTLGGPGRMRGPRRNLMKLIRGIDAPHLERYLTYSSYYRPEELERLLYPHHSSAAVRVLDGHRLHAHSVETEHWLNQALYVDMKTFLPCLNLAYTDKMSMAASTEVRVPLLDDCLVELSGRVPPELKLRRMTRKYIFKRSMESLLPREVVWRKKAGFGAPLRSWLVGELKPMVDDLLSPDAITARGLFDPGEVQRLIAANARGTEDNALRLWALLTLELWQRTYIDREGAASAGPLSRAPYGLAYMATAVTTHS
jgi:asparagine synthase (glutamine-hydrolysing)